MGMELIHRAYSFVCLRCGHGWEAEYDIRLTTDEYDRLHADYFVAGRKVTSPLKSGHCPACESGRIRILRPGRVDSARPRQD
ncbi:hypothetical protein P3H78_28615 [Streptomyces sp. K1PA1]|uniref:Uncharacterized protein n=1 Tax=Streptomyces tropicalis TaxID=3034234 RepID=A0ABT6ADV5_9ACTN|nr:hypothetical protein [Streptomyces tropicalis]